MNHSILCFTILAICQCATAHSAFLVDNVVAPAPPNYRLPLNIWPASYNITLRPYLLENDPADKRFTFDGEIYIRIQCTNRTNSIVMHSRNLKYTTRQLWREDQTANKITLDGNAVPNNLTDIITYTLDRDLELNVSYILYFQYTGQMGDDMQGFYRSSYADSKNKTHWIGATQFEMNHARRAFPCFDEPKFKATYTVTLKHHRSMNSISNTRTIQTTREGELVIDVYAPTPHMSIYTLAFVISNFVERSNGIFSITARPEYYDQTEYAFDVGQETLNYLSNYMGIDYNSMGIDKMHLAAIPDFSAGAMENWGLLTYREQALLYDQCSTTLKAKQYIASVIVHEQTHMWLGNLVTLNWWSYTWLNEGFARYFQYFGTAMVEKYFETDMQYTVDLLQDVMVIDSTNDTHPMSNENTNTPAELISMFDTITYNKGSAFIRMVRHVMGEEQFQKSIQEYLKIYSYQNTVPSNLFEIWKKYFPTNFTQYADGFFLDFTTQVGYPLVTFNLTSPTTLEISQKRFLWKNGDGANATLRYTVPISYTTDEANFQDTTPKLFITPAVDIKKLTLPKETKFVIGNIQETGYYRVNYDNNTWHNIQKALTSHNWGGIHELNRAQIVDDLFNLAFSNAIDYELCLQIVEYLKTETKYQPWIAAFNGYIWLIIRLGTDTANFGRYIRSLSQNAYDFLGFEEKNTDSALDIYNRAQILSWSCKFGNSACIQKSKKLFKKDLKTNPVPVNIRSVVYCTAMREGTEQDFDKLFNKFKTETVATEQILILHSLGCVKDSKLVEKYFNIILSHDIRRQDKAAAMSSLYSENNENVERVFDLIDANLDKMVDSMGGYYDVAAAVSRIGFRFTTKAQETKFKAFNSKNKIKFGTDYSTLESAEKTLEENLLWSKTKLGTFRTYLEKRESNGSGGTTCALTVLTLVVLVLIGMILQ